MRKSCVTFETLGIRQHSQIGSAILLLFEAVATMMFVVRECRRGTEASNPLYTRSVKKPYADDIGAG
jgi:hypothetical protein